MDRRAGIRCCILAHRSVDKSLPSLARPGRVEDPSPQEDLPPHLDSRGRLSLRERRHCRLQTAHIGEELAVGFRFAQFVDQEFHGLDWGQRV